MKILSVEWLKRIGKEQEEWKWLILLLWSTLRNRKICIRHDSRQIWQKNITPIHGKYHLTVARSRAYPGIQYDSYGHNRGHKIHRNRYDCATIKNTRQLPFNGVFRLILNSNLTSILQMIQLQAFLVRQKTGQPTTFEFSSKHHYQYIESQFWVRFLAI